MTEKNIEVSNAFEELREIVEKCNHCGICKALDPIFRATREESLSPRGRAALFSKEIVDSSAFDYAMCGACAEKCPFNIDMDEAVRKARKILNLEEKENPENQRMLKRVIEKKNPFTSD